MRIKNKLKSNLIVLLILLLAILIRIIKWPNAIYDINCDEAMLAINAKSIAETGKDIYGTSFPVYFEAWIYGGQSALPTYLTALCIKLFGYHLFAIRLPSLVISLIAILIAYLFCKKVWNQKTGILVLLLLAISPWHIIQSQWNLDCNLFPHIIFIATYFLLIGVTEKKKKMLYGSMILYGLSMYSYGTAIYFVPIFLILMVCYLGSKKLVNKKDILLCFLIYMVLSIPIFLMYVINFFDLDTIQILGLTIQKFEYTIRNEDMLLFSKTPLEQIVANRHSLGEILFYQYDSFTWNTIEKFGIIYFHSIIFVFLGILSLFWRKKKENHAGEVILFSWFVTALLVGILINQVNINRLNIIWYPFIILTGVGIEFFCSLIKAKKLSNIAKGFIILLYLFIFCLFCLEYYTRYLDTISNSYTFSEGLVEALEYVKSLDEKKIVLSNQLNTSSQYPYYKYVLDNTSHEPVKREEELIYYYAGQTDQISWLNTADKIYETEQFSASKKVLHEEVYLIKETEMKWIQNIEDYEVHSFRKHVVLKKKI